MAVMTEIDDDKDEAFKAIKESITSRVRSTLMKSNKTRIDTLDKQTGFNPISCSTGRGCHYRDYGQILVCNYAGN